MWRTYDVEFRSPRYDEAGNRIQPGRISVDHNGRQIHNNAELPDSEKAEQPPPREFPVALIVAHDEDDAGVWRHS